MSGNDEHQIQNSNQLWEERKEIENEEDEPWDSMPSLMFQKRYMYPNVHCSTIYNSQDMEAT